MSSELTKPPSLLAPERFLTGSGPSWSPGPCRRPQPLPKSSERAEGGLRSHTHLPSASPPSSAVASELQPLPAGQQEGTVHAQAGKLITLGNSPKPIQCSLLPSVHLSSLHYLFAPLWVCCLWPPLSLLTLNLLTSVYFFQYGSCWQWVPMPFFPTGNLGVGGG